MSDNAAMAMKARLRGDLLAAMKQGQASEAKLIRALIAAIDNAEAPPLVRREPSAGQDRFGEGTAEISRLSLNEDHICAVLTGEIEERETVAAELERADRTGHAEILRAEAQAIRRYL